MSTPVKPSTAGEGAEELRSLAELVLFLSTCFLDGPNEEKHGVLSDPEWLAALLQSGILRVEPAARAVDLPDHRRRFEELLRIPGDHFVSPFEQGYHERKATVEFSAPVACEQLYRRAGYVREPYATVEADHIGHQLRFLSALLQRYAGKLEEDDNQGAAVVLTWIRGFFNDRCWWWPSFSGRLLESDLPLELEVAVRLLDGVRACVEELVQENEA